MRYPLLATARQPEQLRALIDRYPETIKAVRLDVMPPQDIQPQDIQPQDIQAAVEAAIAIFGRINVLVNSAGHGLIAALKEGSDPEVHQFFETNFFEALRLMRTVLPVMRQQGSGHIVNL